MKCCVLMMAGLAATVAVASQPLSAQSADSRISVVDVTGEPVPLEVGQGSILDLLFDQQEKIQKVIVSDPSSYQVIVARAGDGLYVRALRSLARGVNMTVRTDMRNYEFLLSQAGSASPYVVLVRSRQSPIPAQPPAVHLEPTYPDAGSYKVGGDRTLRPVAMRDDGLRTYIEWSAGQAIPAVFASDRAGHEEMVNGFMRNGVFTIDRVHPYLVFRIDKAKASATRITRKRGK